MMSNFRTEAVLVVGHGSRREEANEDVRQAALRIGDLGLFPRVTAAFLEIASPTIAEGFAQLVTSGATHIIVHPYFLSPGRHTRGDIPIEVRAAASQYPHVSYQITEPLAAHRFVIEASIERIRETASPASRIAKNASRTGKVYLVGAGPGDFDLLTVKALHLLRRAEVVIYDHLVDPYLLEHVSGQAERIYAGKVGRGDQTPQNQINRLLIERAREGKLVVRLKGGDPFLFGRGGEEAVALSAAGVPFEIVPGVSSAIAAPAYAGIPLTHRALSSSVAIVTGARAGDGGPSDELVKNASADTLVVLMGLSHLRHITEELIAAGRPQDTPVAVIRWATSEAQQTVVGNLMNIVDRVERAQLSAPAVIVIGEVVRLREQLKWFEQGIARETELEVAA